MSKTALMGSIAAALLASGCAVSGPSLLPGLLIMLDDPEEQQEAEQDCGADCTQAKTTESSDQSDDDSSESSSSEPPK